MEPFQEISVQAKERATLGATKEAQDVTTRPRNVVPMGAFVDPNNPAAASGSVNMSLDTHPVEHAEGYGGMVLSQQGAHPVLSTVDDGAEKLGGGPSSSSDSSADDDEPTDDDRSEWSKVQWVNRAKELGIPHSGVKADVQERVERFEAAVSAAKDFDNEDWTEEIGKCENPDELAGVKLVYDYLSSIEDTPDVSGEFEEMAASFNDNPEQ